MKKETMDAVRKIESLQQANETYARLVIYHQHREPESITELLQLKPSDVVNIGDVIYEDQLRRLVSYQVTWTLSTLDQLRQKEVDAHIDWILLQLFGRTPALRTLRNEGARIAIRVYAGSMPRSLYVPLSLGIIDRLSHLQIELSLHCFYLNSTEDY